MINYRKLYSTLALMLLNILVLLLFLNIGLFVVFEIKENFFDAKISNPVSDKYGNLPLKNVYPHLSEKAINDLLSETWSRPYIYEPFTQFKERPYEGHYVNVDQNGFRISRGQGPWPPDPDNFNVFLFGGSTTFGYGVPDDQTVASHLQEIVANRRKQEVRVYNFGRGFYYSTQERILFETLLVSGYVPDMAIFMDGLNEFYYSNDRPLFTDQFEEFVNSPDRKESLELQWLHNLPMNKLARSFKYRASTFFAQNNNNNIQNEQDNSSFDFNEDMYNDEYIITNVVTRYLENKNLIEVVANAYDIQPVFVWQPVPTYKYDLNYHLFVGSGFDQHSYSRYGYQYMDELIKKQSLGKNFLWVADIQENRQEALYVDKVHYSAEMSRVLAIAIAEEMRHERH